METLHWWDAHTGCDSGNLHWWGNPSGSEAGGGRTRVLAKGGGKGGFKISNDVQIILQFRDLFVRKGELVLKTQFDHFSNFSAREATRTCSSFMGFNLASITAAWTGRRCIVALSCAWKNDAWNTHSSHDTNQMNGVFTYSDNKAALESKLTSRAEEVFLVRG